MQAVRQRRDADNVPRQRIFKGLAHRNSPPTYFMCGSKNFRRVHARVCVDGGGSPPGQTDSKRNSENFFGVGMVFLVLNLFC